MSRLKLLVVSALAAAAVSAVASASASATLTWGVKVGGVFTKNTSTSTEKVQSETKTVSNYVLKKANGLTIQCTKVAFKEAVLEGLASAKAAGLTFTGCTITAPKAAVEKCSVSGTIEVEPGTGTLTGTKTEAKVEIKPTNAEKRFTTITISGTCVQAGKFKVTGEATGFNTTPETPKAAQTLTFTETSGSSLIFGEEAASFTGAGEVELEGKPEWGALE
jgi:hypothetical protein